MNGEKSIDELKAKDIAKDIYGFNGDSLMEKQALYDIDVWKEDLQIALKSVRSELRMAIKNKLIEWEEPVEFDKIQEFVLENYIDHFKGPAFNSDVKKLKKWLIRQEDIVYHRTNDIFSVNPTDIAKDEKVNPKEGKFTITTTEDDNLLLIYVVNDKRLAWLIDIEDSSDIYNLFGKSNKFPAKIVLGNARESKILDKGIITLGVQRDGYHEFKLAGDKFDTRLHIRVVPLNDEKHWVVWTGKKQTMLESKDDDGLWDITEDRYKNLPLPEGNPA